MGRFRHKTAHNVLDFSTENLVWNRHFKFNSSNKLFKIISQTPRLNFFQIHICENHSHRTPANIVKIPQQFNGRGPVAVRFGNKMPRFIHQDHVPTGERLEQSLFQFRGLMSVYPDPAGSTKHTHDLPPGAAAWNTDISCSAVVVVPCPNLCGVGLPPSGRSLDRHHSGMIPCIVKTFDDSFGYHSLHQRHILRCLGFQQLDRSAETVKFPVIFTSEYVINEFVVIPELPDQFRLGVPQNVEGIAPEPFKLFLFGFGITPDPVTENVQTDVNDIPAHSCFRGWIVDCVCKFCGCHTHFSCVTHNHLLLCCEL